MPNQGRLQRPDAVNASAKMGLTSSPVSMSLAVIHSRALDGLQAHEVNVEVHLANGLPVFTLVGLADTEVKEARERC
ncbi:MAG: putative chelatase family protein [Rhizobacter sp.]|nr:putative chelatase family protein [Rhizobacter sp.]